MKSKTLILTGTMRRNLFKKALVYAVCAACVIPPGGIARSEALNTSLPSLGDTEREQLSPQMERKLGEEIMRDIRRDRDYLDDPLVLEYLNNFGSELLAARPEARSEAGFDFFFFAVRDPMINAFALPGGFIGVHSALLLAAQTESELASVLAHEIGHVTQRHIARMLGQQKQDALIPLAAMVLAALATKTGGDAPAAVMAGGQGIAIQRQLNFSREAEREADRIGFQMLNASGFETSGMVAFFGRMQAATRSYNDSTPAYLRTHPMTTERIADIQARIRNQRYRQRVDRLDFHLARARMRVLQDPSPQGLRETAAAFENQLEQKSRLQTVAAKYGLAFVAEKQGQTDKALELLQQARSEAKGIQPASQTPFFAGMSIDLKLASHQPKDALKEAEAARQQFPLSRGVAYQYAQALTSSGKVADAATFLREQTQLYRQEPQLYELLAKTYAAQGKQALQHLALAESYAMTGSLPAALDQLSYARRSPDVSFYDQAVIDAREREFKALRKEEMKESKGKF